LRQENIEKITENALSQLNDGSDPSAMEDDWVTNFFDKSRIVSDEQMQNLWSRVLAGEANAPGTYSKRTVNFLSSLDKKDAELFQTLCSFGWIVGSFTPLVFDPEATIYNDRELNFNTLTHLDSIGLIQFNSLQEFQRLRMPKKIVVLYCGQPLTLTLKKEEDNMLPIGHVLLTNIGKEFVNVCTTSGVKGFVDYVKGKWKKYLPDEKKTEPGA
tara:strand:- start:2417 stop:3058 length:642 start_codon:yes stop_codon:yes gene_type:complete